MSRSVPEEIGAIPHWARVAFAARCARTMIALFQRFWPNANPARLESLQIAVGLSEQSAADGRAVDGLERAVTGTIMTAGAALMPVYGEKDKDEPYPTDENACYIASFVAKAAEWAAKAAQGGPTNSTIYALEAYTFSRDAADVAQAGEMLNRLHSECAALYRLAMKGQWLDRTPVPPSIFSLLPEQLASKPWWKLW